jgi:putative spermidine/putrescine transport system permease protein
MSSSSGPDRPEAPHLDSAELEEVEGLEHPERSAADPSREGALGEAGAERRRGWITAAWAAPGTLWLIFYLLAPIVMIILVSFWTPTISGFEKSFTLDNYRTLFGSEVYWNQLKDSFFVALIVVGACLILGFPIAYFLSFKVQTLRNQIALFLVLLAPFLTSYLIRAVAWEYPLMGRQGAINQVLEKIGVISEPLDILGFSRFSVTLALIQLYILFMITPLFFMLAQVDRSSLEAARDLGGNWWKSFREVILPQTMPGIVIGSIFCFVLAMGDYGTTRIVGGGQVSSVGIIVQNNVGGVQYPAAAASAVFLVLAMILGVFILLRFSNLREEL